MRTRVLSHTGSPVAAVVAAALRAWLARAALSARARARAVVAWVRSHTPAQLLWVFMTAVLLAYLVVLWTASTATGGGGR